MSVRCGEQVRSGQPRCRSCSGSHSADIIYQPGPCWTQWTKSEAAVPILTNGEAAVHLALLKAERTAQASSSTSSRQHFRPWACGARAGRGGRRKEHGLFSGMRRLAIVEAITNRVCSIPLRPTVALTAAFSPKQVNGNTAFLKQVIRPSLKRVLDLFLCSYRRCPSR
jgi:hypothetical protein